MDIYLGRLKQSDVVKIVAVDEDVLVTSINLQWLHRDPVDRIVVALALHNNCPIITKDQNIRGFYPDVI